MEPEEINPLDNLERLDYGELALPAAAEGEDEDDRQEPGRPLPETGRVDRRPGEHQQIGPPGSGRGRLVGRLIRRLIMHFRAGPRSVRLSRRVSKAFQDGSESLIQESNRFWA